jgi:hypothetical protein
MNSYKDLVKSRTETREKVVPLSPYTKLVNSINEIPRYQKAVSSYKDLVGLSTKHKASDFAFEKLDSICGNGNEIVNSLNLQVTTYNPHIQALKVLENKLLKLQNDYLYFTEDISWYKSADIEQMNLCFRRNESRYTDLLSLCESLADNLQKLNTQFKEINQYIKKPLNPLAWFSLKQHDLVAKLTTIEHQIKESNDSKTNTELLINEAKNELAKSKSELDRYNRFDEQKHNENIASLTHQISLLKIDIQNTEKLKSLVNLKLEPILTIIQNYQTDIVSAKEIIDLAKVFVKKLKLAPNSFERKLIHDECNKELNNPSPDFVIKDKERLITQRINDLKKSNDRALNVREIYSRDIKKIIIDGNNLCYLSDKFLGLNALIALSDELLLKYQITIVFDPGIMSLLSLTELEIKESFNPNINIHIVAHGETADETILNIASVNNTSFILSNDRFAEYVDKEAVKQKRLIKHNIIDGLIMVHDLHINLRYDH